MTEITCNKLKLENVIIRKAEEFVQQGETKRAIAFLNEALKNHPDSFAVLHKLNELTHFKNPTKQHLKVEKNFVFKSNAASFDEVPNNADFVFLDSEFDALTEEEYSYEQPSREPQAKKKKLCLKSVLTTSDCVNKDETKVLVKNKFNQYKLEQTVELPNIEQSGNEDDENNKTLANVSDTLTNEQARATLKLKDVVTNTRNPIKDQTGTPTNPYTLKLHVNLEEKKHGLQEINHPNSEPSEHTQQKDTYVNLDDQNIQNFLYQDEQNEELQQCADNSYLYEDNNELDSQGFDDDSSYIDTISLDNDFLNEEEIDSSVDEINEPDFFSFDQADANNEEELYDLWDDTLFEDEESEDEPNLGVLENVFTQEDRARYNAIECILLFGWHTSKLPFLTELFDNKGWSNTKKALEREVREGASVDEIELAFEVKNLWLESSRYWINFNYAFHRGESTDATYRHCSWKQALRLIRTFSELPSYEEIHDFVEREFEHWYGNTSLRKCFPAFNKYLFNYRLNSKNINYLERGFELCKEDESDYLKWSSFTHSEEAVLMKDLGIDLLQKHALNNNYLSDKYTRQYLMNKWRAELPENEKESSYESHN